MTSNMANECPLAGALAERIRHSRRELTQHWLDRIVARVVLDPNKVFPTEGLLDHVPLLMDGIADYLENPANEVSADTPVIGKARELGDLRHAQGFDVHEILKEYELLGGILFHFLATEVSEMSEPCEKGDLLACGHRLFRAVSVIQQATTTHFLQLSDARVAEREGRLRAFNRTVSHEIKNRIGTLLGASELLREVPDGPMDQRMQFLGIISKQARALQGTVENLLVLSRMEKDVRQHRHVRLPQAAAEASRQLRDAAEAAGVAIRISPEIPAVEVNAGAVELCLTNYLSNAIKYADPQALDRRAEVRAAVEDSNEHGREIVVRVFDNGLGVPAEKRDGLFQQFFRAHEQAITGIEGTGLGLSIVRDTVESIGGRAWAEFPAQGSIFAFSLPLRREETDQVS